MCIRDSFGSFEDNFSGFASSSYRTNHRICDSITLNFDSGIAANSEIYIGHLTLEFYEGNTLVGFRRSDLHSCVIWDDEVISSTAREGACHGGWVRDA